MLSSGIDTSQTDENTLYRTSPRLTYVARSASVPVPTPWLSSLSVRPLWRPRVVRPSWRPGARPSWRPRVRPVWRTPGRPSWPPPASTRWPRWRPTLPPPPPASPRACTRRPPSPPPPAATATGRHRRTPCKGRGRHAAAATTRPASPSPPGERTNKQRPVSGTKRIKHTEDVQCSSQVGKRAGCKRNWAQSSARTTKIRAQFSAQTTQIFLRVNDQNLVLWAIDENMGTNLQEFYKYFYIGCLKTQKQQLHFVTINLFLFYLFIYSDRAHVNRAGHKPVRAERSALGNRPGWNTDVNSSLHDSL